MEVKKRKSYIRRLNDMRKVIYNQEWAKTAQNFELYYGYRGIKKEDSLRYDITVIPPRMLGQEFVRTKGNRNSEGYQELYTILKGGAIFLMQKVKGVLIDDVVAVKAKSGDWVIVPPDYAIITINPAKKTLEAGNWVSEKTKNIYEDIEKMKGACYFYTKSGWIKNKNYQKVPELRFEKPLKLMPKSLDFLKTGQLK